MKKLFLLGFLSLGLFSCSEKEIADPTTDGTGNEVSGDMEHSYLSVTIVPANASATRADDDKEGVDGGFRNGSEDENFVESVRFYFFKKDGSPATVKADGSASYYDVQPSEILQEGTTGTNPSVEKVVSALIVIESQKGDGKPAYMAAVLNHNDEAPKQNVTFEALQKYVADYSSHTKGKFTMSSSVYMDTKWMYKEGGKPGDLVHDTPNDVQNAELIAIPVYENIRNSRKDALENKATIYVERVLAKVSASVNIPKFKELGGEKLYEVGFVGNQGQGLQDKWEPADSDKIYVKFLGWNVTADRKQSRLVKRINTAWGTEPFKGWRNNLNWNDKSNKRSYWAVNPENKGSNPIDDNYNFSPFAKANGSGKWESDTEETMAWSFDFNTNNYTYLQENAGAYKEDTAEDVINSKIIVAGQLVNSEGKALELVEWQGDIYNYETDADKKKVKDALAADTDLYIEDTDESGAKTWRKITGSDIEIVFENAKTADEAYDRNKDGEKRYYVYLKLTDKEAKYGIYKFTESTGSNGVDNSKWGVDTNNGAGYTYGEEKGNVVKDALLSVGYIKHWNTGYTYYWVDIRHFGSSETVTVTNGDDTTTEEVVTGYHGVVRNHWYDYTFNDVQGLGVPVSDPDAIIYPEKPGDPEYFYLAAEVKILSWKMVTTETGLGWK